MRLIERQVGRTWMSIEASLTEVVRVVNLVQSLKHCFRNLKQLSVSECFDWHCFLVIGRSAETSIHSGALLLAHVRQADGWVLWWMYKL